MAVCPQTDHKKYWQNLNLAVGSQVSLSSSVAVSCLRHLNKAIRVRKFTRNWQHASTKLVTFTAHIDSVMNRNYGNGPK